MKFTDYIDEEPEITTQKIVSEEIIKPPRNFKSYIKKIESHPVIVMCTEDIDLITECKKYSIKYHIIKGNKYLVENKGDKVVIKDMFDSNSIIAMLNQKNTIVLKEDTKIVNKLKVLGLELLTKEEIKEKLNNEDAR